MQGIISKNAKIAVLCGGMSTEKEVSMRSGKNCYEALKRLGYVNAQLVVVDNNHRFLQSKLSLPYPYYHVVNDHLD